MTIFKRKIGVGLIAALALGGATQAFAAATIVNPAGTVAIGVDELGQLNTTVGSVAVNSGATGVSYKFPDGAFRDATSPGCLCEGWGVSVNGTTSGYANNAAGSANLTTDSFVSAASTATVTTHITSLPGISVTHDFAPATTASSVLYKVHVTIMNTTGATVSDLKYVRVMDWDVPPTEFSEYVTIKGTASTTFLELSHDDGFETADPLAATDALTAGTTDVDFTDVGASDHGAYFKFNFGDLLDDTKYEFDIFYGAAADEAGAIAAIAAESIELYSLGQSSGTGGAANGEPTYIFGFAGVGGTPIETVPEPGSLALAGLALASLFRARRKQSQAA